MTRGFPQLASEAGHLALRLAALLADPLPNLTPEARDRLVPAAIAPLLGHARFRRGLAAHLRQNTDGAILARIGALLVAGPLPPDARPMFEMALLPQARLDPVLARLAAVIHAPRFRAAVLKDDRAALKALFGTELSRLAVEEGLSLLAPLGELDDGTRFPPVTEPGLPRTHPARRRAVEVLCARIARGSEEAAALIWWRITGTSAPTWPALSARQDACLAQLLTRSGVTA